MADVTLKHQTMRSHCAAMNASTEVNGTRFPAPILLCGRGFSTVTFLRHLRSAKHCPFQDALEQILTDIFQMHGILNAIPIFSFGLAKSQAVLQFLSIYLRLVHSSSLFYSATLPQDTTRTALDPASTGFIHEEAREHRWSCTYSGRRGTLLYKGVLTKVLWLKSVFGKLLSLSTSSPVTLPVGGKAFSFSVFWWLVFTNLSRLTIAAGVIPGMRLTAPICVWEQEQVNQNQTYTLGLVRNEIKTCGYSFPQFSSPPPCPLGRHRRDSTAAQPCCGPLSYRLWTVRVQFLPHLCGERCINGKVI